MPIYDCLGKLIRILKCTNKHISEQRKSRLKTIKIIEKKFYQHQTSSNFFLQIQKNSLRRNRLDASGQTHRFITRDSTPDECIILD